MERDVKQMLETYHRNKLSEKILSAFVWGGFLVWLTIWGFPWIAELFRIIFNRAG